MNYRMIKYTLGWLLLFEAAFFLVPIITGIVYWEKATLAFLWALLCAGGAGALLVMRKPKTTKLYSREGFVIVGLSWIVLSLFGALPFVFAGVVPTFADAFFETVSGFTTTGSSVFPTDPLNMGRFPVLLSDLPKCLLIWRSFTNWVGGMGVLVFIMAFLPLGGAHNMNIMKAESPGPSVSKLVPRVKTTALILYVIYLFFTVLQFILLAAGGAPLFDSICISFSTAGTGGFAIRNDSFASYSPYVQIVTTVFMLIFSINFASYYLALRGKFKDAINTELKTFLAIVLVAIAIITVDIYTASLAEDALYSFDSIGESIRHSSFTVASIISTSGFATENFDLWPSLSKTIIVVLMFVGACAGSTGGGIKVSRFIILFKGMIKEFRMIVHPHRVKKITLDKKKVEHEVIRSVNSYMICYVLLFALSVFLLSFEEHDLVTNFTAVATCMNNIGPGLALVGPASNFGFLNSASKLLLSFDMLAGRLELFPMLLLFYPGTYKK